MDKNLHKENTKIALFYSENPKDFQVSQPKKSPALLSQGRAKFSDRSEVASLPLNKKSSCLTMMARAMGFEPTISGVTGQRFKPLSYARICRRLDSNQRPWPYEDPALTTELRRLLCCGGRNCTCATGL